MENAVRSSVLTGWTIFGQALLILLILVIYIVTSPLIIIAPIVAIPFYFILYLMPGIQLWWIGFRKYETRVWPKLWMTVLRPYPLIYRIFAGKLPGEDLTKYIPGETQRDIENAKIIKVLEYERINQK